MSFVTLADILGTDTAELQAAAKSEFKTEKLGLVPYSALDWDEYKQAKKDCGETVTEGKSTRVKINDDKLTIRIIVLAVDKDERTDFTFCNKELIQKLGVVTADQAVEKLLSPGEIFNFAVAIQDLSGFGETVTEEVREEVKNS